MGFLMRSHRFLTFVLSAALSFCLFTVWASAQLPGEKTEAEVKQDKAVGHYDLATVYFKKWNLELAALELEEAISYYPDFKAAHRDLCVVSFLQFNIPRALAEASVVVGLGEPIPLTEEESKSLDHKAYQAHYRLGLKLAKEHKWQDAITEFNWALSYEPNPQVHRSLAFAYANLGDFRAAEGEYKTAFAADPADGFSHADFAFLLSDRGDKNGALEQMAEAVKLEPEAAALHVDLGWLAEASGNLQKAEDEFSQALKLSSNHAELWNHLGRILEAQNKTGDAAQAYRKALQLDSSNEEAKTKLEQLKLSVSLRR